MEKKKPAPDKTWQKFKVFFKEAYNDYKEDNVMTAAGSGFNATKETTIAANAQDTLEHLAVATTANQTAVANLTSANAKISSELQDKNIACVALQNL